MARPSFLSDLAVQPSITKAYAGGVELGRAKADSESLRAVRDAQLKDILGRMTRDKLREGKIQSPEVMAAANRWLDQDIQPSEEDAAILMGVDLKYYGELQQARRSNIDLDNVQRDQTLQEEMQAAILKNMEEEAEVAREKRKVEKRARMQKEYNEAFPDKTKEEIDRMIDANRLLELTSMNELLQDPTLPPLQASIARLELLARQDELMRSLNGEDPVQQMAGRGSPGSQGKPEEPIEPNYFTKGTEIDGMRTRVADKVRQLMPGSAFEYDQDSNSYVPKDDKDAEKLRRIYVAVDLYSQLNPETGLPLPTGVYREPSLLELMPVVLDQELPINKKPQPKEGGGLFGWLKDRFSGGGGGEESAGTGGDVSGVNAPDAGSPSPEPMGAPEITPNLLGGYSNDEIRSLADYVITSLAEQGASPAEVPKELARRMRDAKGRDLHRKDIQQINRILKEISEGK